MGAPTRAGSTRCHYDIGCSKRWIILVPIILNIDYFSRLMISHQPYAIVMASCHIIKHLQSYSIQPMMQSHAVHPLKFSPKRPNSKSQIGNFETQIPSPTQCLFLSFSSTSFCTLLS